MNTITDTLVSNRSKLNPVDVNWGVLGPFTYYRTYSRWLETATRRENWEECCYRTNDYHFDNLLMKHLKKHHIEYDTFDEEKELSLKFMHEQKVFPSGRTMWIGGSEAAEKCPSSNFNCAFTILKDIPALCDLFYLLMVGVGVGGRILKKDVAQFPTFKGSGNTIISHKPYEGKHPDDRKSETKAFYFAESDKGVDYKEYKMIYVGDSKEGWVEALRIYLELMREGSVNEIMFIYNNVRPRGERLKTFGGRASGHDSIQDMFVCIHTIFEELEHQRLRPIDILDIANIIGKNVVVGGTRRTAETLLIDTDDEACLIAKNHFWESPRTSHRNMSNNSILYYTKPTREQLDKQFECIKLAAEPNFVNMEAAQRRRPDVEGLNPCYEIILRDKGFCNLSTIILTAFVKDGELDMDLLMQGVKVAVNNCIRITLVDVELPEWDKVQKEDRLLGVSITGFQDAMALIGWQGKQHRGKRRELLSMMKEIATSYAKELSNKLNIPNPMLVTTVKPEGCWTKEFTRQTDQGILFMDEIDNTINKREDGFKPITGLSSNNNKITKSYVNPSKELIQLKLKNGRILKVTPGHPLSINNNWVESKDIEIGTILDFELGTYSKQSVTTLDNLESMHKYDKDAIEHKVPTEMSNELSYLIGAYFANGSFPIDSKRKHQLRIKFHCQHLYVHKKIQSIWKQLFGIDTKIVRLTDRNSYTQDLASVQIRKWLEINGLLKPKSVDLEKIPLKIRTSTPEQIIAFFAGYADNNGYFHLNSFCIDSASERFMKHMQEVGECVGLCFGLSINSKRSNSYSNKPMYKIHLSRSYSTKSSIDLINDMCTKAKEKPVLHSNHRNTKCPFTVTSKEYISEDITYDIEVENTHWYYQGAIKSHNTLSCLPTVSSGLHWVFSEYMIRRIRISSADPLVSVMRELNYPVYCEVGDDPNDPKTYVIEFPVHTPTKITIHDVTAIEQLENYLDFQQCWTEHNSSNTVYVEDHEWEGVVDWVENNWDDFVAVAFMRKDKHNYKLAPFEKIDQDEYLDRVDSIQAFDPEVLKKYETGEDHDVTDPSCSNGVCPVR